MMGRAKKRARLAAVTAAFTGALVLGTAGSAFAINRVSCNQNDYLWLSSDATTCWAYAGSVGVTLYNVYGLSSGNNAGWVDGDPAFVTFAKWVAGSIPQGTYRTIDIY